jgi:hypothetical protein
MRLIDDTHCLLITQRSHEAMEVYMSCIYTLDETLRGPPKRTFQISRLGQDPLFAVDESRRLLVVYGNCEVDSSCF